MGMPVSEFLARHNAIEIRELMAFHSLEPFGDEWRQTGLVASAIYNCAPYRKGKALKAEDFMPIVRRVIRQSADAMARAWRAVATVHKPAAKPPAPIEPQRRETL